MKKILSCLAVLVMGAGILTGCVNNGTSSDTFVVGMECNYAPWNWTQSVASDTAVAIDGGQYCDGYDVQVARQLAESMGKELVIKKTSWDGLILALQAGEIDAIIAGMSPTAERKEEIDFSDPYFLGSFGMMVQADGPYKDATSVKDFSGARVTAQMGTFHVELMDQLTGASLQAPMKDFPTMTVALQAGEIDAYVAEESTGKTIPKTNPDLKYVPIADFVVDESMAAVSVGIKKGNTELLNQVNEALSKITTEQRSQLMDAAIDRQSQGE
ncbi:transporter substrate-binding domain-containing protein [Culicoidibacter larvae]|uniref:Transporter substrate-binding domain-containing protein n=1 Tax=Culicoidibacter larvae TaxID=2579976 RepID=A0A5R8QAM4_9FIRM|nr:transporter substrate-binding domain-containing protein [Culicoidibacter larvae]TLG72685.1 transporter substrate-binding domain-containing protein [Culicoidibacter larvae]